jgi:hypothetical protein
VIILNYASKLIFFAQLAGGIATARQANDVPIAVGRSNGSTSVYHILSRFLHFIGEIEDVHKN